MTPIEIIATLIVLAGLGVALVVALAVVFFVVPLSMVLVDWIDWRLRKRG